MIIHFRSYTNICCNKNLLYTGSHGVVSIRHNFVCNHNRCRFLVFRNFVWGKINALKENLSEKQFLKQIFEDLKKKGNEINSGIIIPLFLYVVTICHFPYHLGPLPNIQLTIICISTSQEYTLYGYTLTNLWIIWRIETNDQQPSTFRRKIKWKDIEYISKYLLKSSCGLPI